MLTVGVAFASTAHADDDAGSAPGQQAGTVSVINPTRNVQLRTTAPTTKQHWISHQDCVDDVELTFRVAVTSPSTNASVFAYVGKATTTSSTTVQDSCLYNKARNDLALCRPLELEVKTKNTGTPILIITAKQLMTYLGIENCGEGATGDDTAPLRVQFYFLLEPGANDPGAIANYAIYEGTGVDLWGPEPPTNIVVTPGDEELQLSFTAGADPGADQIGYRFFIDDGTSDAGAPMTSTTSGGTGGSTSGAGGTSATTTSGAGGGTSTSAGSTTSSASSGAGVGGAGGAGGASTSTGVGGMGGMSMTTATSSTSTGAGGSSAGGAGGMGGTNNASTTSGPNLSTGVTGAGNIDACSATAAAPVCTAASFLLSPGQVPTATPKGDPLVSGTVGTIGDLKNGQAVVVAVAAYDDVGNIGKLSELQCGTPLPVLSILRAYECSGGLTESGCGFCSVGGERGVSYTALVSAGLFVFGFAVRRSRRTRVASGARGAR